MQRTLVDLSRKGYHLFLVSSSPLNMNMERLYSFFRFQNELILPITTKLMESGKHISGLEMKASWLLSTYFMSLFSMV